ncbi:uncharacterized protein MKZ38_002240 [Zalerion maritima]|uniref:Increased loss of mitochondrial DNA protein 1 n=1 Tax=Zalerion maritima TaxID=339359 RepID=A0AAD5WT89_9PEZI|nr:uncharacterized protein MKZ38_002240 [Zalerion maritima]
MALISGKTILTSISLFHITLGFFFLTNPLTISDQALVYILGEAMGLPHVRAFETPSPPLAFLAAILMIFGLCDLVTLSMPDEIVLVHHWGTQAPLRLFLSIMLVMYSFFFSSSSPLYATSSGVADGRLRHPSAHLRNENYVPSGWGGDGWKNRVFFTFMFVEMASWFWAWVTLREERREFLAKKMQKRRGSQGGKVGSF